MNASLRLTYRSPAVVIISHLPPDHWGGLQVFAGSTILATPTTRQRMVPWVKQMQRDKHVPSRLEKELRETEARLSVETDPGKRQSLQNSITRQRHTLEALPTLEPTLPNQTFERNIVFSGKQRSVVLIATGKGHTVSDCILSLPQDRVAFIGDIGFFLSQPFMAYGYPAEWLALLDNMATWDIDTFVPGHGPLGSKTDLDLEARYIRALEDMVQRVVQAGGAVEDALSQILPTPYDKWQARGRMFEANVHPSYSRHSTKYRKQKNRITR